MRFILPPMSERNMCTGSTIHPSCFTHVCTTLKISLCFKFNEFIPSVFSSSGNILGIKLENAEFAEVSSE